MPDTVCVRKGEKRAFSCTLSVLAKIFLDQNSAKQETLLKLGFQRKLQKSKNDTFFWKRVFLTWLKKWVLLIVFLKSCVSWKHYFYSVFSKTQFLQKQKLYVEKTEIYENSGLFFNMAKWCFWGVCFFWGFNITRFVFGVSGIVWKVLKNACFFFPSFFGGCSGVAHCCSSGFGRFRCFCVSCVCFSFLCCLCFCFVCFVLGFVFGCCCFVFFVVFLLLEGLRVRWGGPKGHRTWP